MGIGASAATVDSTGLCKRNREREKEVFDVEWKAEIIRPSWFMQEK
jgi:hypothetical protein